jgi:condensin complex subunit 1
MDDRANFDINESLKLYLSDPASIPTPEAPNVLTDCETDPDALTPQLVHGELNGVVDAIADHPDSISRSWVLDTLQFLLKCAPISSSPDPTSNVFALSPRSRRCSRQSLLRIRYPDRDVSTYSDITEPNEDSVLFALSRSTSLLPPSALSKILDLLVSGLSSAADLAHSELFDSQQPEDVDANGVQHHKQLLEIYGFLLQWSIATIETKAAEKPASSTAPTAAGRGRKGGKKAAGSSNNDANWDAGSQLQTALDVMAKVMKLKLARIFLTTSERDTFISLFTRPVYLILESEARVKVTAIRMHAFRVLCIAVKHHGHAYGNIPSPDA